MHVWQVLQKFLENKLFVKAKKCEFRVIPKMHYREGAGEDGSRKDPVIS